MTGSAAETAANRHWMALVPLAVALATHVGVFAAGPTQPDFTGFEPVTNDKMVNEFTGDFTYNIPVLEIPGANGGGYSLSLSYHSGTGPEEEASWVGYGWTLNPGSIVRQKRGYPDDWKGEVIQFWNRAPANKTVALGPKLSAEGFSLDLDVSAKWMFRFNNYKGFGNDASVGLSYLDGLTTLGLSIRDGEHSFSFSANPGALLTKYLNQGWRQADRFRERSSSQSDRLLQSKFLPYVANQAAQILGSNYGYSTRAQNHLTPVMTEYKGKRYQLDLDIQANTSFLPVGATAGIQGFYTTQTNVEKSDLPVYGYMYSKAGAADPNSVMDYHIEKDTTYNKRDSFLGMPFSNADSFVVSGQEISGAFRMYHAKVGHFRPNAKKSETTFYNVGVDVNVGSEVGAGAKLTAGVHDLEVGPWETLSSFSDPDSRDEDEPILFRFNGDLGGSVTYGTEDGPQRADISVSGAPMFREPHPNMDHIETTMNSMNGERSRSGRSSYIAYSTHGNSRKSQHTVYLAYCRDPEAQKLINRRLAKDHHISEFSIVNENGVRYTYGLPVYSAGEKEVRFGLRRSEARIDQDDYLAHVDFVKANESPLINGHYSGPPYRFLNGGGGPAYATTWLLTSITDRDYIDLTLDGPTDDDLGGWTRFVYAAESQDTANQERRLYRWRVPFSGLKYERNDLSNPDDDTGAMSGGEKEIFYLARIETKTHVAIFDRAPRDDALDVDEEQHVIGPEPPPGRAYTPYSLERLQRIRLHKKGANGDPGALIRTVNFEYDYSLMPGIPNGKTNDTGRLTLKRVWFDEGESKNPLISPYEFEYTYPTEPYPEPYARLQSDHRQLSADAQNPHYSPHNVDVWGKYQHNGIADHRAMRPWVRQNPSASEFDPAAWQLKVIRLPTGGEIHVQYEQDDYLYVQQQRAHAMVSLSDLSRDGDKYYLNAEEIGVQTQSDRERLRELIQKLYVDSRKKVYFKFLYKLLGDGTPELDHCNADYITGYINVSSVGIETKISSAGVEQEKVVVTLGGAGSDSYHLPKQVCENYVETHKLGMLSTDPGDCSGAGSAGVDLRDERDVKSIMMSFLDYLGRIPGGGNSCKEMNFGLSYLRVPVVHGKKGGGLRVKRLLMFDKGTEPGDARLYGEEYLYETRDPTTGELTSSGVATTEPLGAREESILVQPIARPAQGKWDRIFSGRDKKQVEGPLGESVMPAPSVGYAKVIVKSIHEGKTNPGFTVHEFHTARDPGFFEHEKTPIDSDNTDHFLLPLVLMNFAVDKTWLSQGFTFKIHNLHGRLRQVSTYAGDYGALYDPKKSILSSSRTVEYFRRDQHVELWNGFEADPEFTDAHPGKEVDLVVASSKVTDDTDSGSTEFDVGVGLGLAIPIPFFSIMPRVNNVAAELATHVTTKVIHYPVIEQAVTIRENGVTKRVENVAFDPRTGRPVLTKTLDGYDGLELGAGEHSGAWTRHEIPAAQQYEALRQKALKEKTRVLRPGIRASLRGPETAEEGHDYHLIFHQESSHSNVARDPDGVDDLCESVRQMEAGDLISVGGGLVNVIALESDGARLRHTGRASNHLFANQGLNDVDPIIVRSGRTNELTVSAGEVTTYGLRRRQLYRPDAAIVERRESFVAALNEVLASGVDGTIPPQDLPPGLEFVDPETGECRPMAEPIRLLHLGDELVVTIGGTGRKIVRVYDDHPMVGYLNKQLLHPFWRQLVLDPPDHDVIPGMCVRYPAIQKRPPASHGSLARISRNMVAATPGPVFDGVNDGKSKPLGISMQPVGATYSGSDPTVLSYKTRDPHQLASLRLTYGGATILEAFVQLEPTTGANCVKFAVNPPDTCTGNIDDLAPFFEPPPEAIGRFAQDPEGYLTFTSFVRVPGCGGAYSYRGGHRVYPQIRFYRMDVAEDYNCATRLKKPGGLGEFTIDGRSGQLLYDPAIGCPVPVNCLRFCEDYRFSVEVYDVVDSRAVTYSDEWPNEFASLVVAKRLEFDRKPVPLRRNPYDRAKNGKWRRESEFVYLSSVSGLGPAGGGTRKSFRSGLYHLIHFNWSRLDQNDDEKWIRTREVTLYSPDGNVREERDALLVSSSARFGYDSTVPYLVASDAEYGEVFFESFEATYDYSNRDPYFEAGLDSPPEIVGEDEAPLGTRYFEAGLKQDPASGTVVEDQAHAGARSYKLSRSGGGLALWPMVRSQRLVESGLLFRLWLRAIGTVEPRGLEGRLKLNLTDGTHGQVSDFEFVARSGQWSLFQATVDSLAAFAANVPLKPQVQLTFVGDEEVWIDDVRAEPITADATCYVYDSKTLRLVTAFDSQHFGTYFQYNGEGKLVRKILETERGFKTIKEVQYNTPVKPR